LYDTKPGSTDAPPEDNTQIMAALHTNVTLESKKWVFIGIVALTVTVLLATGIVVLLVANSRNPRAANNHFDF
jgi:uncharacterized iron-regulated membrane protein